MGSSAKKILVVEDDPIVGHDIRFRLLRLGYDVVGLARTGPEAVSMVDERNPALVLMDIHLPDDDGDGVSSARRIRAATDIPIIFTTGLADEHTLARARLVEPAAFLMKPLEIREIQIAIETSLARLRDERNACTERTRFHAVLQSIDDGVIAADLEGRVRFMNAAAARLTGWGEKDAVGRHMTDVLRVAFPQGAPDPWDCVTNDSMTAQRIGDGVLVSRDGLMHVIEYMVSPLRGATGGAMGMVVSFQYEGSRTRA